MKTVLVKVFSIILAIASIFGLYSAVVGIKDVSDAKKYWEKTGEEAEESFDTMDDGISQLLGNYQTYVEGVESYEQGLLDYEAGLKKVEEGEKTLAAGRLEFESGSIQLAEGHEQYDQGQADLKVGKAKINYGETELAAGKEKLEKGKAEYAAGMETYNANAAMLADAEAQLEAKRGDYEAGKAKLALVSPIYAVSKPLYDRVQSLRADYDAAVEAGDTKKAESIQRDLNFQEGLLNASLAGYSMGSIVQMVEEGQAQIAEFEEKEALLNSKKADLAAGKAKLDAAAEEIRNGEASVAKGEFDLGKGRADYADGKKQLEEAKALLEENDKKLEDAKKQLEDGEKELEAGKQELLEGEKTLAEGKAQLKQYEDGQLQLAEGLDTAIGTETYFDSFGEPAVESIADRLGKDFTYWTLENGKEVVKNENKLLDLDKAAEVSAAGRAFLADTEKAVTKELTGRIAALAVALVASVLGLVSATLAFFGVLKASTRFSTICAVVAVAGVVTALILANELTFSTVAGAVHGLSATAIIAVIAAAAVSHCGISYAAKLTK